jgi:hypothetical protein
LTPILDLCAQSIALLIKQYQDSERLQGLLCALIDQVQDVDDAAADVYARVLDVNNAEGVHLDLLGRIVGETRNGTSDLNYRRAILARVLVNRSQGRIGDLIDIVRVFLGFTDSDTVRIQELQPFRIEVRAEGALIVEASDLLVRLKRAKASGVALQLITFPPGVNSDRVFRLIRAADYPEKNEEQGLSMTADPTFGGYLPHVLA